jgi:MGT family glycosyltransferase
MDAWKSACAPLPRTIGRKPDGVRVLQTMIAFSGNAPPQLAVTRRLVERGHDVRVLGHRAARERIERTGAGFVEFRRSVPNMDLSTRATDSLRDWEAHTRFGAGVRVIKNGLLPFIVNTSRDCAELLKDWPTDVVVFDWMLSGAAIAAEGAGVPAVMLVHCPFPLPLDGVPPLYTGLQPHDGRLGATRDRFLNGLATRVLGRALSPALNQARAERRLPPLNNWTAQLLGVEAICVMTAPELDFSSRGKLPANVHYVGPAFEHDAREWSSPWPQTNRDPLIVLSFSTSYMNQQALAQRALDAVAGLPVRALLTAGPALDLQSLRLPANARAVAYVPHRAVLPHAALVVTHCGWQTVNAALADGIPLICIPDGRDQPDNAARVLASGAGIRVRKNASPVKLGRLVIQALNDPALKRAAENMADALAADGAVDVAKRIEHLG